MRRVLPILLFLIVPSFAFASTQLCDMTFNGNTTDTLGGCTPNWNPSVAGTPTYPAGRTDNAIRTSHNSDDGGDDFEVIFPFPASGEVYISWWVLYEPEYNGLCSNGNWNVKWLWSGPGDAPNHTEHIFQTYNGGNMGFNSYQSLPSPLVDFSETSVAYTFGEWAHVEIYWKQSTDNGAASDGIFRAWVDNTLSINQTTLVTGNFIGQTIKSPALKATCSPAAGLAWWQLDDLTVWNGMPDNTADIIPNSFTFTDQTGVALGSTNNSDNVTLAGFDNTATLALTGDASCKYSINGADWATGDNTVTVGDNVALQSVASGSHNTAVTCTLNLGGTTDTFSRTTLAAVNDPVAPKMRAGGRGGWR